MIQFAIEKANRVLVIAHVDPDGVAIRVNVSDDQHAVGLLDGELDHRLPLSALAGLRFVGLLGIVLVALVGLNVVKLVQLNDVR